MQVSGRTILAATIDGVTKPVAENGAARIVVEVQNGNASAEAYTYGENCSQYIFQEFAEQLAAEVGDYDMQVSVNSCSLENGGSLKASVSGLTDVTSSEEPPGDSVIFNFPLIG